MIILTVRTDKPEAEISLFEDGKRLVYEKWQAHRMLAETIHTKIKELLESQNKDWQDVAGVVCFEGPGSFTGLRIGLTAGNSLAYGLGAPVVAAGGKNWQKLGIKRLLAGENDEVALPKYGAPVHITEQRK